VDVAKKVAALRALAKRTPFPHEAEAAERAVCKLLGQPYIEPLKNPFPAKAPSPFLVVKEPPAPEPEDLEAESPYWDEYLEGKSPYAQWTARKRYWNRR
jgi:hypothetical protein